MKTKQRLYKVFAKAFEIPVEAVNDELQYQQIAEWDSMSHLVLISELESFYDISIGMEDVLEMNNVQRVREVLHSKYGVVIEH
ncbi:acyl carrier protein [Flavivirga sp. 57AJ16]|uniref:acyl carrier protein n=1 Tax=Flavivirga sp. 57AJ16 TaxID=3025307 RepID=UPI002365CB51|nr:acyl carrier protein [Flavivirga sp. 57AJ16]MDD7887575.1 acyl carrier protein [Flavivirga sp. 57AJ16]